MSKKLIIHEAEEREICERFYNKVKKTLKEAHHFKDEESDFETFKYFLQNTDKPPKEFFKIYTWMPSEARKAVLRHLGYKTEAAFKASFSKQLNVYRQSIFRREDKEDVIEEI